MARLNAWVAQLNEAAGDRQHPLHAFAVLVRNPETNKAARLAELLSGLRSAGAALPGDAKIIADYTRVGATPWKSDGPSFGARPLLPAEFVLGSAAQPVGRIMPYGAAHRDGFWNRLSLTPGTEMDSGSLGATARSGRTLMTPKVTLVTGRLHYLLRGKAQVYAGVDSHIMVTGPLHGALIASFDTGEHLRWVTHDLSAYAGHRAHVEISPQGDADLDVLMVVDSPTQPEWLRVAPWLPGTESPSFSALVNTLQSDFMAAVDSISSAKAGMEPRLVPLASWLAQNSTLLGAGTEQVSAAAADFFHAQEALEKTIRWDSPAAVSWADGTGVDEHVLIRGKPDRPGEVAPRGLPEAFGLPRITPEDSSGRAGLARQLTDPVNPLVARVIVNRVWHHLFGRGLVPTVDNFGWLGERPTHPELLDHLAWQFVHEDGWSLKKLIRRLVLTDAFSRSSSASDAQAAEIDPSNLLLHHFPVRRLEGEAISDSLLVISGRFDGKLFGPPVPVHLTEFIVGRGRPDQSGPLDGSGRRSVYIATRRNFLPTMMLAFDLPTPFSTVGRRNVTNVPAQSLVMMNDPFVREQAAVWAARLLSELPQAAVEARLSWLFETAFARVPSAEESRASLEFLAELNARSGGNNESAKWAEMCHALINANEFIFLK